MVSTMRVLPLPSVPTQRPWSGGSRLNWLEWAVEPKRFWKWLRPSKLAVNPGVEVVTGCGWLAAPTDVLPPELWLRFEVIAPSEPVPGGSNLPPAEVLLAEGCRVCISSSSPARIEATAAELRAGGGEVHALAADLADAAACDRLFAWTVETLGGLDVLVNNTGGPPAGGVMELDDE